jgi:hypothetical protein
MSLFRRSKILSTGLLLALAPLAVLAQIDPTHRNLLQLGYDQPLTGRGPQALYAYYYYNQPDFIRTNVVLRLAIAPVYLDSELAFKQLISPTTDFGIGLYGGGYGDNYYEVRQGQYWREESFDGHGGGASVNLYQLTNPGMEIPLHAVLRGGFRYTTFEGTDRTANAFQTPDDRATGFARAGLRFAGKEPVLYPDLGLEVSAWVERQWRSRHGLYGYAGDRGTESHTDLFWAYAGLNYAWTNIGHKASLAVTAGGSDDADRFSAWRLGGVLPLVSEFPLVLPGYYYQELTARRFVHLYGSYLIPLDAARRWQFRLEAASAAIKALPGFEQRGSWQTGAGCGLTFTPASKTCQIVLRYGYGFNALRDGEEGSHSVGLLVQYDFDRLFAIRRQRSQ